VSAEGSRQGVRDQEAHQPSGRDARRTGKSVTRNCNGSEGQSNRLPRGHHRLIDRKLNRQQAAAVADILIERTREEVTITLRTARPGLVIGSKGAEVDKLREELEDLIKRKVAPIKVIEIKNPDLNGQLVAEAIAEQLKKRAS